MYIYIYFLIEPQFNRYFPQQMIIDRRSLKGRMQRKKKRVRDTRFTLRHDLHDHPLRLYVRRDFNDSFSHFVLKHFLKKQKQKFHGAFPSIRGERRKDG